MVRQNRNINECIQMTIAEFHRRLQKGRAEAINEAIEEIKPEMIARNKGQLQTGINSKGEKITPGYRGMTYAAMKNKMNPRPGFGVPDLKLSGKFYRGFKVEQQGKKLDIYSDKPDYAAELAAIYSDIFGLTKQNLIIIREKATRLFIQIWKRKVGI